MRKLGVVLAALGGFLVMAGILGQFWAPGQLQKTPLDVDSTTRLAGNASLGDEDPAPVKATSVTRVDTAKSNDEVVSFANSNCLVRDVGDPPECVSARDPQKRLISASTDYFATDRVSARAVNDPDHVPPDATPKQGLINKWPFESKRTTYPLWDSTVGATVDAVYDGQTTIDGLRVYKYVATVEDEPTEITDGIQGTYSSDKTIYVEPLTGSIVNQVEHRELVTDEGDDFLILDLSFTEDQVKSSVADAKDSRSSLRLISNTVPLIGWLLGLPLLLGGIALIVLGGRRARRD